jgi:hypothetical protein
MVQRRRLPERGEDTPPSRTLRYIRELRFLLLALASLITAVTGLAAILINAAG